MHPDELQSIPGLCDVIYGAEPFHAHSAPAIDAGLWPLVPVLLWGFVILRYLLRNYSLRVHLHALAGLFGGMPPFARIGAILFCAICISFGLPKMNPLGGLICEFPGLVSQFTETVAVPAAQTQTSSAVSSASPLTALTAAQTLACSVLAAAETNVSFTLDPPSNAVIHQPWVVRGAHEDVFTCAPQGWRFTVGTNTFTNVYVSSSGTLAFRRFQGSPGPVALGDPNAFYLAPLQAVFGIAPAANWDLLSASNSLFWHDVTGAGSARFTWRNAMAGRSPDAPVSFQAELLPSGDFTFRYDLGATPWPSGALAGTRLNGGGENALAGGCTATDHRCASLYSLGGSNLVVTPLCARLNGSTRFALHWKAFLPSDLGDPDNDGLDTADELLVYHTGPRDDDSDDDMDVEWDPAWGELRTGANYHTMDVAISCIDPLARVVGSHKVRVHACKEPDFDGGGSGEDGDDDDHGSGPCCDRYPDCERQYYGVPRSDDPDHPEATERPYNPVNKVLVLNTAPDDLHYAVDPEPTSGICPYCGHAQESAGANNYATVTYCSDDLTAAPGVLRRSGEITVNGRSPSTNLWSSVLTIFHGAAYDMLRYTVLGGSVYFDTPGYTVTNAPWPCFAAGVTNALTLKSDVLIPDGDITVSLDGNASLSIHNRITDQDEVICTPTQRTYTVSVSLWRQRYCAEDRSARAFLTGHAACAGKITLGYAHPSESQAAFTAAQRFEVAGVVLEPVTARNAPSVYNPAGVAFNALAAFEIEVYPTSIPDDDITWSIAYGDTWFYNTGNKGRIVYVRGGTTEGDFKLEVDIAGVTLDPKPHIHGKVVEPRVIPLYVFNICDTNGVPAMTTERINEMVSTANAAYKQAGMSFYIAKLSTITNQDWFNISYSSVFQQMCSYTNNTGGLEIYCVKSLPLAAGMHSDINLSSTDSRRGLAIAANAEYSQVLAHEIGHACSWLDVYFSQIADFDITEESIGSLNWEGGYY